LEFFQASVQRDPGFALGYAGLAFCYYWLCSTYLPDAEMMPKIKAAAMRALELDDTLAEAHTALAVYKTAYEWDWPGAERAYRRALELNPGHAPTHHYYGLYLVTQRRAAEALVELKRAQNLDPLSAMIAVNAVWPYYFAAPAARNYDQALADLHRII